MDGKAFLGAYKEHEQRNYIHAAADRFDESYHDPLRTVRDERYKLIKYYDTDKPMFYPVAYREQMSIMRELHRLKNEDQLTNEQALWFRGQKPPFELFDTELDPHEINNLAEDPEYADIQKRLFKELESWLLSIIDLNMMPEQELMSKLWPDKTQPVTSSPKISKSSSGKINIQSSTSGATIGYKIIAQADTTSGWKLYTKPIEIEENQRVMAVAHRLGFRPSEVVNL